MEHEKCNNIERWYELEMDETVCAYAYCVQKVQGGYQTNSRSKSFQTSPSLVDVVVLNDASKKENIR
jgi:hypothetical protein